MCSVLRKYAISGVFGAGVFLKGVLVKVITPSISK
jgi:hypothetical protein